MPADSDARLSIFAEQFASAFGKLAREQVPFPQALRPIRNERTMRRTGHRIFRNTGARREVTGHKIAIVPGRGHDHALNIELRNDREIGFDRCYILLALEHRKVIAPLQYRLRLGV